ncbi:MAG: LolA-related protein [Luteimonas sp.]
MARAAPAPATARPEGAAAAAAAQGAAAPDPAWILARIARPAPSRTPFVELRGSKLLKSPLRISGEYRHPDAATLVREVRAPYAETTTIRAGEATIERPGKAPRRVSLARYPELAGLQATFGAVLAGDATALRRHYRIESEGRREAWRLRMTPLDAAVARRVRGIELHGRGAELRCIETEPAGDAAVQRTLLAGAARDAASAGDEAAIAALCGDGGE